MIKTPAWNSRDMYASVIRSPTFDTLVAPVQFGPRFFYQANPYFRFTTVSEAEPSVQSRKIVINDDSPTHSIKEEIEQVTARFIDLLGVEERVNVSGIFCHRTKHSQQVTISKHTLINVVGVDSILEYFWLLEYLADSFPQDLLKS